MRLQHARRLMAREIPELDAQIAARGAVLARRRAQDADVGEDEFIRVRARGAEVEELELVGGGVVEEVGPVGVRLHVSEFGDFAQAEAQELGADPILLGLGEILDLGDADAFHALHSQDLRARGFGDDLGDGEDGAVGGEEGAEGGAGGGFARVVAFPREFGARVGDGFVEVETFGKEA